jgi:hypothetical protein
MTYVYRLAKRQAVHSKQLITWVPIRRLKFLGINALTSSCESYPARGSGMNCSCCNAAKKDWPAEKTNCASMCLVESLVKKDELDQFATKREREAPKARVPLSEAISLAYSPLFSRCLQLHGAVIKRSAGMGDHEL